MFSLFRKNIENVGSRGENQAEKFLRKQGYKIIERNFRIRAGEIDIIAKDNDQLVFVEVKTRTDCCRELLTASINRNKQRRMIRTAQYYLVKNKYKCLTGRFDVIFVTNNGWDTKIEHIKDAFTL